MNSLNNWDLRIDSSVLKVLQKIPRHNAKNILEILRLLPANPYFGDIQKMKGKNNIWRRRIGSYRIFYKIQSEEKIVLVFHLERRNSKTY